jgi:hypothetical protein
MFSLNSAGSSRAHRAGFFGGYITAVLERNFVFIRVICLSPSLSKHRDMLVGISR